MQNRDSCIAASACGDASTAEEEAKFGKLRPPFMGHALPTMAAVALSPSPGQAGNSNWAKKTATRKRGRPPLPKGHVKANIIPMRLKDEDLKAFSKAAKASKLTLSEWMRVTLREAVQGQTAYRTNSGMYCSVVTSR